ncbi:MAG: phosphatase [Deltaproteobacteria bacterium CG11_big_fil_rev_8_21_14_0_20_47_16]|nr:MAG: phosphatase [Deltaproteobacteria bacterium CG11_big_fil_rev_8_21_14_0_20_47_16]
MPFATIDIGTNAVLLLIGEKAADGKITSIHESAELTRLGQGLGSSNRLHPDGMQRTLDTLKAYADICKKYQASPIVAVGTSAFRRATNAQEFVDRIQKETGIQVQIISGDEEASLSFDAARAEFGDNILVIDIGGGSTEFIWKTAQGLHTQSLKLGAVTLQENYGQHDPLGTEDAVEMEGAVLEYLGMLPESALADTKGLTMVGIAGTVTTLAAMTLQLEKYDHEQVHGHVLSMADVERILSDLLPLSTEERKKLPGLEPKRADVIYPGALILEEAMEHFGKNSIVACHHGIRWGLAYRL